MNASIQQLQLIVPQPGEEPGAVTASLGDEATSIEPTGDGAPRLTPAQTLGNRFVIEPLPASQAAVLISPPGGSALVNGMPVPHVAVIQIGDEVELSGHDRLRFHLTVYNQPHFGVVAAEFVGRACPHCTIPFDAGTRVYTCKCGCVLHAEESGTDPLKCAEMVSECPGCSGQIVLREGLVWNLEDAHVR
jgi:hypothetical protein